MSVTVDFSMRALVRLSAGALLLSLSLGSYAYEGFDAPRQPRSLALKKLAKTFWGTSLPVELPTGRRANSLRRSPFARLWPA